MTYIKSPLNYTGGKYKILPQILPLFPEDINVFVDLFGGGANVSVNVDANTVIYNDIDKHVVNLLRRWSEKDVHTLLSNFDGIIKRYELSKTNKQGYLSLRNKYNESTDLDLLYMLIAHSFNNQIRFNSNGEFNLPFGDRYFSPTLKDRFIKFVQELRKIDMLFMNDDFRILLDSKFNKNDFIYADPPYLLALATYNEKNGWTEKDDQDLLDGLDKIDGEGAKFALSNVFEHKGKENVMLKEWAEKYVVHKIDRNYSHASYNTSGTDSVEVLITNY